MQRLKKLNNLALFDEEKLRADVTKDTREA
jgi:hypothetical protein